MPFTLTNSPTHQDIDLLKQGVFSYSAEHIDITEIQPLALFYTDEQGAKLAGLCGSTAGNWLRIDILWVGEALRGQRIGSQLVAQAEAEALARGCCFAQVDTMSFQARPFYEKLGYVCQLTLANYPRTHQRYYLTKHLAPLLASD